MRTVLISGDDPTLLSQEVRKIVKECLGAEDPNLSLSSFETQDYMVDTGYELSPVLSALATPPMLGDHRVVEARHLGLFSISKDWEKLYEYLANPLDTSDLILVWEKGANQTRLQPMPKQLKDAVSAAGGEIISTSKPRGNRGIKDWFGQQIKDSGLLLDTQAQNLVRERLGEDMARLHSVLDALKSAYGSEDAVILGEGDVGPYLGEEGATPIWELTAALSKGDGSGSLKCLRRRINSGEHPLAVLAFLVNHYMRVARLDGASQTPAQAAKELGISEYPAKLAMEEARRLGTKKIARIFEILMKADRDIKGQSGLDANLIMEILIARVAQQYRLRAG